MSLAMRYGIYTSGEHAKKNSPAGANESICPQSESDE
jgi:hypothetical protein